MNKLMNKVRKNKKGFTLIELIVVIAILGILVLLAAPKFLGYTKNAKVATMQADAKVLSNAALVYNIEEGGWPGEFEIDDDGKFVLENGEKKKIEATTIEITNNSGEKVSVEGWELKEGYFKDRVQTLKNDFEDYVLVKETVTVDGVEYKAGDIIHKTGVEDKAGVKHYGVAETKVATPEGE